MTGETVLLVAAIVAVGLVAGFLGGWAVSAVPGLRRVDDRTYVATMQSVNRAILNPLFLVPFMSAMVLPAAAAVVAFMAGRPTRAWLLVAATATYTLGVFAVTAAGNVPLNNELDRFDAAAADEAGLSRMRHHYEDRWNRLHTIRSLLNLLAFGLATVAALAGDTDA